MNYWRSVTSDLWFVKDPCGIFCIVLTYMLVFYGEFVVMTVMLHPQLNPIYSTINGLLFNFLAFMALASHARTMLTDPGVVPRGNATEEHIKSLNLKEGQVVYKCTKCCSIKPLRAHHCSICERCVRKMDHHCPWVNNCVGENNQKYFVLFTMYISTISIHSLIMVIVTFCECVATEWKDCVRFSPPATVIMLVFLTLESLLFALFTLIMFGSQLSAICSDETGIETLKRDNPLWQRKSCWLSMKSVFGDHFSIHWFSPFATPIITIGKAPAYLYHV